MFKTIMFTITIFLILEFIAYILSLRVGGELLLVAIPVAWAIASITERRIMERK